MTLDELPGWAEGMLSSARVGHLAFVDDRDRPRVLPVTYALAAGHLWSAVDQKPKRSPQPARVRYLRRRPEAALCVDVYDDDWSRLAWVQVVGSAEVMPVAAAPEGLEALKLKYEPYGVREPQGPLIRLQVARAMCWRGQD